ncbi:hypothetical protein SMACR_12862 [Sordaria macrospora]|uniref:Uncharacterized protein n=1 Tax=Sordaria macrospora TaxID=5147 RepID=A0A8S8ZKT1_SORMA|nr:hypothetical protein SMACR_12862 [Sordaria macrospora]WPJ57626.1 hypothetical protein SMAC4_13030 [Sordaria macrospora]
MSSTCFIMQRPLWSPRYRMRFHVLEGGQ